MRTFWVGEDGYPWSTESASVGPVLKIRVPDAVGAAVHVWKSWAEHRVRAARLVLYLFPRHSEECAGPWQQVEAYLRRQYGG